MPQSPCKSLLKAVRNDDYRHWKSHVDRWEGTRKEPLTVGIREEAGKGVYSAVLHQAVANLHFEPEETEALDAVQHYFGLTSDVVTEIKRPFAPKALKMLIDWFLTDGILTSSERAQLQEFGDQMGLSGEEITGLVNDMLAKKAG